MNYTVNNWMVLIINSDAELVTRGVFVLKRFFNTEDDARKFMIDGTKAYAKAKDIDINKYDAYVDCGDYFVQMNIVNCSKDIHINTRIDG